MPDVGEMSFLGATRAAYDVIAADYAERFRSELADKPLDRALLAAFAELVRTAAGAVAGVGPVAGVGLVVDVGCGPGHVTAQLEALGLSVFGVDLSPEMLASARRAHPGLRLVEGSMTALGLADGAVGGVVALYSIMNLPPDRLPGAFAEFHRVLAPGGHLLLAFLVGEDEQRRRTEAFGRAISLDYHLRSPDGVADLLNRAGLVVQARLLREPDPEETVPRAFLLARKPA